MISPEILVLGKFTPDDLVVSLSESNRKIDPKIEAQIDAIWEEKKKKAEEDGRVCYNGTTYRLNSLKEEGGKIVLDFGLIDFKTGICLGEIPRYFDLPEAYYKKGCYNNAIVKTSDDHYLIVEMSGKSMNSNNTDLLGGIMEKPMEMNTNEDVFNSIYIELMEESCIIKPDIKDIYLRAIYLNAKTNVGFYFEVTLNISAGELQRRFTAENKDPDIKSLKDFSREEYLSHLRNHKSENKQFVAEIIQI